MSDQSASSTPSIRTFQMDASTVGVLKSSVNLFRGDINSTQSLFTLPGRANNDGLEVDVSIQYQSNVHLQAMTWNRDQPTGVLGMGWSLPMSAIRYESDGSTVADSGGYSIALAGVESRLQREPADSVLFSLDASLAKQLANGKPVPTTLRTAFVTRGLPLAATATVEGEASPWTLVDDANEMEYRLTASGGSLVAATGGRSYQLVGYKFWRVTYYPRYERWAVANESGQVSSFGGGVRSLSPQVRTSAGNAVEWAVEWLGEDGRPVWRGSSAVTTGQSQYAVAWHLTRSFSRFGESVFYGYNEFARNADGLLPDVEQRVGAGGCAYTKACYLTSVTDVFGRKATFQYGPKLWSNATTASPREYADPHKAVPDNAPNGFQDRYETKFLKEITVDHVDGTRLFSIVFDYDPSPGATGTEAVANVAPGGSGDTCKRLLTGFRLLNPAGDGLPGYRFDYELDTSRTDTNLGALRGITWPTGGTAGYTYKSVELPICQRTAKMTPPNPMPAASTPRVWFGQDYAVVVWYSSASQQLSLQIMTWNGQWRAWQAASDTPLLVDGGGGTNLSTVTVLAANDFVALTYDTSQNTNLHLFRKDPARPGQWCAADIPGGGSGGRNAPTWHWAKSDGKVELRAGEAFVLASQMNTSKNRGTYNLFTWNWPSRAWSHVTQATETYTWFATGREYFVCLDMAATVSLNYLSPTGAWSQGRGTNLGFKLGNYSSIALTSDVSLVAVSHLTSGGPGMGQQGFDLYPLLWNDDYQLPQSPPKFSFVDKFDRAYPTSWAPTAFDNAMVAVGGNMVRFNGQTWLANSNLKPSSISGLQQRYAFGPDCGTLILVGSGAPTGTLLGYDADTAGSAWTGQPTAVTGLVRPPSNQSTANWAACDNPDYIVIGTQLFFRGTATDWGEAVKSNIADLQSLINQSTQTSSRYQVNSASVLNEAPGFLACAVYDNQNATTGHATAASALVLRNGQVYGPAQMLAHEQMWTSQETGSGSTQGKFPGGPMAFFTYPDTASLLDNATTVSLHRYAGDAIQGPISDWPVASITINDGLAEISTTTYVQDTATAGCDATGKIVKYFKSTVYPGGTPSVPANGSVTSCYLNGNAIMTGANYYNALDGLLHSVTTRDAKGREISTVTNGWTAFVDRAGSPTDPGVPPTRLYGAYVLQTVKDATSYGVSSVQTTSYAPDGFAYTYTGQAAYTATDVWNGAGQQEPNRTISTYACEVNEPCRVQNDLSSLVSQTTSQAGVITSKAVTALALWPSALGDGVLIPAEEADFSWTGGDAAFPFATYLPGDVPDDFMVTSRIERRDSGGSVLQQVDGAGTRCSSLFSAGLGFPVATFKGATLGACAWCGFQRYETTETMRPKGTSVCTDNAWLGLQSLRLPVGAGVSPTVADGASGPYVLGYRYRTEAGYQGNGSPWFGDTGGKWRYVTVGVSPAGGPAPSLDALHLTNQGNGDVLLDSVLLVPLGTDVTVQVWHPRTRQLLATTTAGGDTSFMLYDAFNRNLGALGPKRQLQELDLRFLSRQGSTADRFEGTSPNTELTIQMADGGTAENFRDGGDWATRWRPADSTLWVAVDGTLAKTSANADSLTWQPEGAGNGAAAFFVAFRPTQTLAGPVSLCFGDGNVIAWTPSGAGAGSWSWRDGRGERVQTPLAAPVGMANQWLLLVTGTYLVFFGDGQLLFSQACTATASQGCRLDTGPNPVVVTQLMAGLSPRLGLSYTDGAARQRQVQQMHGDDSRVMAFIYDSLDRQVASTRVAPGRFGSGAARPTLAYSADFVDVPAFLAAMADSWAMNGDIADYYAGQTDGPVVRSNDHHYPYSGLRYEAAAKDHVIESGKPGPELAIRDVATTTPAERHTTRTTYTASGPGDPVAADRYLARDTLTPTGCQGRLLTDTINRAVATVQMDTSGANVGQTTVAPSYTATVGTAGTTGTLNLPNAFTTGPQTDPKAFVRTTRLDPMGQVARVADPDCGETCYLYDGKGQPRFIKTSLEAGENRYQYTRYDTLGRIVEEGLVNGAWDQQALAAKVNDPSFPGEADGAVPARNYTYDGNGDDAPSLGQLLAVVTRNPAPSSHPQLGDCTVSEAWSYDTIGRVTAASLTVSGPASRTATARYTYNTLNEVKRIDLPEGCPLAAITYSYDDQGHIVAIGVPGTPDAIASYTWSADGQVQTAKRGALAEVWNSDSPGNVIEHQATVGTTTVFHQSFAYTDDGQIKARATTCQGETRSASYAYDGLQRLTTAVVEGGQPGNQSVTSYDANGNVWAGSVDGKTFSATYATGCDKLSSAVLPDGTTVGFHYRADGNPDQWRGLAIGYDTALGTTATVTAPDKTTVRYVRGINNHLAVRQKGASVTVTLQGAGNTPLVTWVDGSAKVLVWGPTGLAAVHDGTLHYPVCDQQHTVWAVVDAQGTVEAAFDYLPFGGILRREGTAAATWPYLFCGKQWDEATGLYDFGARLYDPTLLRFLAADPARQYASPYVYASNNPLNVVDPSGNLSMWARVGIGVAMLAVAVAGIVGTVASFGAATAPTAAAETALAGAAVGGEATMTAAGTTAAVAASEGAVEAGAAVGAGEVAAGAAASVAAPLTTAQVVGQNAVAVLLAAGDGALSGAGFSGLSYDISHGRDFTAKGFFAAVGTGALTGFACGAIGGLAAMPATVGLTQGMSATSAVLARTLASATASMIGKDVATLLTDAITGQKVTVGQMLMSSAQGFGTGALGGCFGGIKSVKPETAAVSATDRAIVKASNLIAKGIDKAKQAAKTDAAVATYIAGGFFLVSGYTVWGVSENSGQQSA